jgi:predicted DNA-binding WGR domain protein
VPRYEFSHGTSNKFWEVALSGKSFTTTYGKIGSVGQKTAKTFATPADARNECDKLVAEKRKKGYVLVGKKAAKAAKPETAAATKKTVTVPARRRLAAAFADLNADGIVALQNVGYTMSDGWSDTNEAASEVANRGPRPRGACFYHQQDFERGKRGEGLSLAFGSYKEGHGRDAATIEIGKEIVATLKRYGFAPKWNQTVDQRIHTGKFPWK